MNKNDFLEVERLLREFGNRAQGVSAQLIELLKINIEKEKLNQKNRSMLITLTEEKKNNLDSELKLFEHDIILLNEELIKNPHDLETKEKLKEKTLVLNSIKERHLELRKLVKDLRNSLDSSSNEGDHLQTVFDVLKDYNKSFANDFLKALEILKKSKGDAGE